MDVLQPSILEAEKSLTVDAALFDRDVIYRAAYLLTDRAWLWLEPKGKGIGVRLTAKVGENADVLAAELGNLLIDQAVRKDIARETEDIRRLILQRAIGGAR